MTAALTLHRVARAHADRVRRLQDGIAAPVVTLPFVFATELGPAQYELLAHRLLRPARHPRATCGESAATMRDVTDAHAHASAA